MCGRDPGSLGSLGGSERVRPKFWPRPFNLMFNNATFQRVTGDAEQTCCIDNGARRGEGFVAEFFFGSGEIQAFECEAHRHVQERMRPALSRADQAGWNARACGSV